VKFNINKQKRFFPNEIWNQLEGKDIVPRDFQSNGCSFSPDYIKHYDLWPACHIHDYDYSIPGRWADRREADLRFRGNLTLLLEIQYSSVFVRVFLPYIYWWSVRIWGPKAYIWSEGEKPLNFWQRFVEVWGWFKDKRSRKIVCKIERNV
jgi:hypothetical protein